jgi:proton-translocating NADH-quinone oxidoreductase chain M
MFFLNKFIYLYQILVKVYKFIYFNISFIIGIDGLAITLIILSFTIILICFLIHWHLKYKIILYYFILFLLSAFLLNLFLTVDLFFFYIFFEGVLIPTFFLIGIWGSRSRKIYAAYLFFFYTLSGAIFILIAIFLIYLNKGTSNIEIFLNSYFFETREILLWFLLFIGFSVKIPILPFHIWLPEAHVEAPTAGSVILAGILLKLGSYAVLRLLLGNFFYNLYEFLFFFLTIAIIGLTYSSMAAFAQIDIKKIIAYSSIAHMNFMLIGIFSNLLIGLSGSFMMMISHAITSSALFFCIGVLYDRYKTRIIFYYGGLVNFMPLFSIFFFIFILSNFGFPGTLNFVGELLIMLSGLLISNLVIVFSIFSLILTLIYSLFFYNKIFFGQINIKFFRFFSEINRLEFFILLLFFFIIIIFGIFPNILLKTIIIFLVKFLIIF